MRTKVKDIALSGLSTAPNDLVCEDGNLAVAIGMVHEDGALKMAAGTSAKKICELGEREAAYQHKVDGETHIITRDSEKYGYFTLDGDGSGTFDDVVAEDVVKVTSAGNFLMFYTKDGSKKYLWKGTEYVYVGDDVPMLNISFGLKTKKRQQFDEGIDNFTINMSMERVEKEGQTPYHVFKFDTETINNVTNAVFGAIGKFVEESMKKSEIVQPHLITYCYRMFDGQMVSASSPVLLIPANFAPLASVQKTTPGTIDEGVKVEFHIDSLASKIDYSILNNDVVETIKRDWADIIKSVCIFISEPLYVYDLMEKVKGFDIDTNQEWNFGRYGDYYTVGLAKEAYGRNRYMKLQASEILVAGTIPDHFTSINFTHDGALVSPMRFTIPKEDTEMLEKKITDCSQFYLVREIDIRDLVQDNERHDLEFYGKITPSSLRTQERMSVSYTDHTTMSPTVATFYNGRMNLAGVSMKYYTGFDLRTMVAYQNADAVDMVDTTMLVHLTNDGVNYMAKSTTERMPKDLFVPYLYYGSPDARTFMIDNSESVKALYPKEHAFMNGALAYACDGATKDATEGEVAMATDETLYGKSYSDGSTIYTSELYNPFVFKAENVERVGNGDILAIVPATMALSVNQSGPYDGYVFTTEGIWALSVSGTGGWASKMAVSRDVMINKNSILQLDKSIIFATKRGLMHLSGPDVECISEVFDGADDVMITRYGEYVKNALLTYAGIDICHAGDLHETGTGDVAKPAFMEYLEGDGVSMHYDYRHQRIIIANDRYDYCYCFGMKDKLWTCIPIRIRSSVNSYPDALANIYVKGANSGTSTNVLVDLTEHEDAAAIGMPKKGMIVTRTLKLDAPQVLKTVTSVVANGTMDKGSLDLMLYASNDLRTWKVACTTKGNRMVNRLGTPYRYWRVGVACSMARWEELNSLTVTYETREEMEVR